MARQFLVIGAGWFGSSVAQNLYALGHEVMVMDNDEKQVKMISNEVTHAIEGDATSEESLKALGIKDFNTVILAIGDNLQVSIMATIMLIELEAKFIVAKAQSELHGKVLEKLGVDHVVFPERDMGKRLARNIIAPSMIDLIELSDKYSVVEVAAKKNMIGKTLKELDLRKKHGINVIALRRDSNEDQVLLPLPDDIIQEEDVIVAIGSNEAHKKMQWI
ncbi:MAG: TrkA family potassium uptake protein [Bacillota bacterium]|nr:TrkA family potassium uptake protein [Bacillota bacterium]